jgi:hypothetical protein
MEQGPDSWESHRKWVVHTLEELTKDVKCLTNQMAVNNTKNHILSVAIGMFATGCIALGVKLVAGS